MAPAGHPTSPVPQTNGSGSSGREKLKQRRSRKVCQHCHERKIKCTVAETGTPCSNCIDSRVSCVIRRRKNGRLPPSPSYSNNQNVLDASPSWRVSTPTTSWPGAVAGAETPNRISIDSIIDGQSQMTSGQQYTPSMSWDPNNALAQDHGMADSVSSISVSCDFSHMADLDDIFTFTGSAAMPDVSQTPSEMALNAAYMQQLNSPSAMSRLNGNSLLFLPNIPGLSPTDQEYLRGQGCFELPPTPIFRLMMQYYFRFVHSHLPIVPENEFWRRWDGDHFILGDLSLLVVRAMIFAATSYTELDKLSSVGFLTKRDARGAYYRTTKLLFDFNVEHDPIANAQACLLMTYYAPNHNKLRVNSFWLTNAAHHARIAQADSYHQLRDRDPDRAKLLKKVWWGVIFRDRILSLGLRRALQIQLDAEWDEEGGHILSMDDFESELGKSFVHTRETQCRIIENLGALCRLMQCLTPALQILYRDERVINRLMHAVRTPNVRNTVAAIQQSMERLRLWHEHTIRLFPFPISLEDTHDTICVYGNMLFFYYSSAVFALNIYLVLVHEMSPSSRSLFSIDECREVLETANVDIMRRTQELLLVRLVKYLPISASALIALPLVLQAINVAAARGTGVESVEVRKLDVFTRTLKSQQQEFDGSDFCADVLGNIIAYAENDEKFVSSMTNWRDGNGKNGHSNGTLGSGRRGSVQNKVKLDWGNLVYKRPKLFLRLVLYLDHALCTGGPPVDEDFPGELRRDAV